MARGLGVEVPVIHSDCPGSKGLPVKGSADWERKRGICPVCLTEGRAAVCRIFKDREGVIVLWPHEGDLA